MTIQEALQGWQSIDYLAPLRGKVKFSALVWIFTCFSILGFVFEGLWSIKYSGVWASHYSTVWGHLTIIYGFAAVILYFLGCYLHDAAIWWQFLAGFLGGSALEFVASFLQEATFGSRSWSYYHLPYNLDGRICLEMSLVWGVVGVVFMRFVFSWLLKFTLWVNGRFNKYLSYLMVIYLLLNFCVTGMAVYRWGWRVAGETEARNRIETYLDANYDDEKMKSIFYNMDFVAK